MQSRRELEQLFNSIVHIIVVIDPTGALRASTRRLPRPPDAHPIN